MRISDNKKEEGITLIALIITVVIMIILSVVTINIVVGGGLIDQAKNAAEQTGTSAKEEQEQLDNVSNKINSILEGIDGTIPGASDGLETGSIIASPAIWENEEAKITLRTNEKGMRIQYQVNKIDETNWNTEDSPIIVENLKHGDIVYARLTDGKRYGNYASVNILDKNAPTISINTGTITENSIQIISNAVDAESGIATYEYYLNDELKDTLATNSYTFNELNEETSYNIKVVVTDKAGNRNESNVITVKTQLGNRAPVISSTTLDSKTTNSITIKAKATDANGDKITYELYTSTSNSSGFTKKATESQMASGSEVTLKASGLSQYTTYYYYVIAKDEDAQTKGSTSSVRTYCPGTGLTCSGPFTASVSCSTCEGTGEVKCQGEIEEQYSTGSYTHNDNCDSCGGNRSIYTRYTYTCTKCNVVVERYNLCFPCTGNWYKAGPEFHMISCDTCSGSGEVTQPTACSHGQFSSHTYCNHGYTAQHD